MASATSDQFLLAEAEGTIWSGSAITVLTGGANSHDASVLPTRLEWTLRPRWNGVVAAPDAGLLPARTAWT